MKLDLPLLIPIAAILVLLAWYAMTPSNERPDFRHWGEPGDWMDEE